MELMNVYKCAICGNIVEVMHVGGGSLVCCNQPMALLAENTTDAANEKHVPVIEKTDEGWLVKVGEVDHPMIDKHYIEWIELINTESGTVRRKYLKPGDKPQYLFKGISPTCQCKLTAREYCNLHGHWKADSE